MPRTDPVIRLVGGPRPLDGRTYVLSDCHHDRADLEGDRFVRVIRGTTVMSLAALHERCTDRRSAEELAEAWGCAVFTYGRDRRLRTRYFRYQAAHRLEPVRDAHGHWSLVVGDLVPTPGSTSTAALPARTSPASPVDGRADEPTRSVWAVLEAAVDESTTRFAAVGALLPDGPLAERAESTRLVVGRCVSDAARLCGVGATVAADWQPGTDSERAEQLATRVSGLIGMIDQATTHLVDLHLEIGDGHDPAESLAHLRNAWTELDVAG